MNSAQQTSESWRIGALAVLAVCFFLQSGFVYSDYPRESSARELSAPAREGFALWRTHNCQACHQLYGFGGFLGPDLTNIVARRPHEDWTDVLTEGRKQMPAFHFDEAQRETLIAFLSEFNETGISLPRFTRLRAGVDANFLVRNYLRSNKGAAAEPVVRGEGHLHRNGCNDCHVPFGVGTQGAPDMTVTLSRRSPRYVRAILRESKGAMPAYDNLSDEQIDEMLACLEWMNQNRRKLGLFYSEKKNGDAFRWASVPWFEY